MNNFPYPGLRPFREDESEVFFGREEQIDQLLNKLGRTRFLAAVGLSGCGKSSLVRAGLLPALKEGFLVGAGENWLTATMRPGDRPMRNLAKVLPEKSVLGSEKNTQSHAENIAFLLATLRRGPLGLVEALDETPLPENTNILILIDQFEDIFRYSKKCDVDEANAFIALLLASVKQTKFPVFVMITMRSDFLGNCPFFPDLPEMMNDNQFLTSRLTRDQCRAAIVGPADMLGGSVKPRLVNTLLNEAGTDPDQLPLLQHCLMQMWRCAQKRAGAHNEVLQNGIIMTMNDYETVGGLKNALSNHADEAFLNELNERQQKIAECLFRGLSERGADQRDTRNPVSVKEVAAVAKVSSVQEVIEVVEVFRHPERCFITPAHPASLEEDTVLDISHESLIRQWKRMNDWVGQEAKSAETYKRLVQTACLWKQGEARLWDTPDLGNALRWRKRENPTAEWANRYDKNFKLAMEFLDASVQAQEKRRIEKEKRSQEERERQINERVQEERRIQEERRHRKELILKLVSVGLIIAVSLAAWAFWERLNANKVKENLISAVKSVIDLSSLNKEERKHWKSELPTLTEEQKMALLNVLRREATKKAEFLSWVEEKTAIEELNSLLHHMIDSSESMNEVAKKIFQNGLSNMTEEEKRDILYTLWQELKEKDKK